MLELCRVAIGQSGVDFVLADRLDGSLRLRRFESLGLRSRSTDQGDRFLLEGDPSVWLPLNEHRTLWTRDGMSLWETVLNGDRIVDAEVMLRGAAETDQWVLVNAAPIYGPDGPVIAGVFTFSDLGRVKMLEEERSRILSMFAHDMKSPLIAASGFLERLLTGKTGPLARKQSEYLEIVLSLVKRVHSLAQDFLDLARLSLDRSRMSMVPVDLGALLTGLRREYEERAVSQGLEMIMDIHPNLPEILGDPSRLSRVVTNLLDNALKYAGKGRVELRAEVCDAGQVRVDVLDQGAGLSDEDLDRLFQPFFRGRAVAGTEGSGLGLAAVRAIVEAHGGRVEAANRPEGGARFTVFLNAGPGSNSGPGPVE